MGEGAFPFEGVVRGLDVFPDGPCEGLRTADAEMTLLSFFVLPAGLMDGAWLMTGLLFAWAYGSAVAGRCPSGRLGRLRGPERSEPDAPDAVDAATGAFDVAAGGWRESVVDIEEGAR